MWCDSEPQLSPDNLGRATLPNDSEKLRNINKALEGSNEPGVRCNMTQGCYAVIGRMVRRVGVKEESALSI